MDTIVGLIVLWFIVVCVYRAGKSRGSKSGFAAGRTGRRRRR